ncbi:MAG: ROK family protein [Sphingobium sp.]
MLAGVELGGTKCICIAGTGPDDIRDMVEIPTTTPDETLEAIAAVLDRWDHSALGLASFGPIDLDPASPTFGAIVTTPKPGWSGTDITRLARERPFAVDTDVNGAALAEGLWGAARGLNSWAYITVGTGIGVGSIVAGQPVRGLGHSEAGHVRVARVPGDAFTGCCPYHGDCVEGLASGPAIAARAGHDAKSLCADDPAWAFAADALAGLCHNLLYTALPQRILIGGGVANGQSQLLPMVRDRLTDSLGGYGSATLIGAMSSFIAAPALGNRAGPLGALAVAGLAVA